MAETLPASFSAIRAEGGGPGAGVAARDACQLREAVKAAAIAASPISGADCMLCESPLHMTSLPWKAGQVSHRT